MRGLVFTLAVAGFLVPTAANSTAMYGRVEVGLVSGETSGVVTDLPLGGFLGLPPGPDWTTDTGFAGFAVIGADLVGDLKIEAELGFASAALSNQTDISEFTAMANAVFDISVSSSVDLVFGAGVGFTNYSWDAYSPFAIGATEMSDTALAYQAIAGADIGLSPGIDLSLRYRYRMAETEMTGASIKYGSGAALANLDSLDSQIVTVGLTFGL